MSLQPDWQIDNGLFNWPIMVHTQILIHRWGPRRRFNEKNLVPSFGQANDKPQANPVNQRLIQCAAEMLIDD